MSDKKREAQKRPAYRKTDEEAYEKIKAQELAALEEIRERIVRLRELRLKKKTGNGK